MKKTSFSKEIFITILAIELITLIAFGSCFYKVTMDSQKEKFLVNLRLVIEQIESYIKNRIRNIEQIATELSLDNALKVSLLLKMNTKLEETLEAKSVSYEFASFYVWHPTEKTFTPKPKEDHKPLLDEVIKANFEITNPKEGKFFIFPKPIQRNDELLGYVIAIYNISEDRALIQAIKSLWQKELIISKEEAMSFYGQGKSSKNVDYYYCSKTECFFALKTISSLIVHASLEDLVSFKRDLFSKLVLMLVVAIMLGLLVAKLLTARFHSIVKDFIKRIDMIVIGQSGNLLNIEDLRYEEFIKIARTLNTLLSDLAIVQAELREKIQQKIELLATTIKQSEDSIIIVDSSWRIEYVNPAFEKTLGISSKDIINKSVNTLWTFVEDLKPIRNEIIETLSKGKIWNGRMKVTRKTDGNSFVFYVTVFPVKYRGREVTNYVVTLKDITEHVVMEKQLVQKQKMEALGTLAGGIAHDFNNIMTIILNGIQLALMNVNNSNAVKEYLDISSQAILRAKEVVKQILAFTSGSLEEYPKIIDVSELIKEALPVIKAGATPKIEVKFIQKDKTFIYADPSQIYQVMINLASNSIYAMKDKGGSLEIILDSLEVSQEESVSLDVQPGRYARIIVSDTGSGIPEEIVHRIFEPYFTTKPTSEGSGMGLSIAYGTIKNLKGSIRVLETSKKGTKIEVLIPSIDLSLISPEKKLLHPPIPLVQKGLKILFVDDDSNMGKFAKQVLESYGSIVKISRNPEEVLDIITHGQEEYNLIIVDFSMPEINGIELIKRIRSRGINTPAILITSFNETVTKEEMESLKIKTIIQKPFSAKELLEWIGYEN